MARSEMAGRVRLFEHYTSLTDLASQSENSALISAVENTINLSTKLMVESDSRETQVVHNILQLQIQCSTWMQSMKDALKGLRISVDNHVEGYTNQIMELQVFPPPLLF
jgi:uncharacterized protein (DUF2342 family)